GGKRFVVVLNLGREPRTLKYEWAAAVRSTLPPLGGGRVVLGTHPGREGEQVEGVVTVQGDEGVIVELDAR
ncbi:MAG TPA: hypothetical protein VF796_09760, partial [Humisphaera sp.]